MILGVALLAEQVNLVAERDESRGQARVVDVGAGPAQQVAVEDQDAHASASLAVPGASRPRLAPRRVAGVSTEQRYRLRNPATGREVLMEAGRARYTATARAGRRSR